MSIRTSIHFGQHQCRGKWVFYLSKATFKYIEDFISPLLMRRCFVLQQFYHSDFALRHAAFARNTRDANLNSAHLFAAKNNKVSCVISRWHACPSFPLQAFVLCMHVCNCLIVLWPPVNCHFTLNDRIQTHPSHPQRKPLDNRPHAFFPPNSL